MDEYFTIKTENNSIEEDSQHITNKLEIKFPVKIEEGYPVKDEVLDIEFIAKEEPYFPIEDDSKKWNINDLCSEEVSRDDNVENQERPCVPWPLSIHSSGVKGARMGVWTETKLPRGLTFGPYEGRILNKMHNREDSCNEWKIQDKGNPRMIIDADTTLSNWLHFITCSQTYEKANLAIFQYRGQIYNKTLTEINRNAELMMWYCDEAGIVPGYQLENHNENSTTWVKGTKTSHMIFFNNHQKTLSERKNYDGCATKSCNKFSGKKLYKCSHCEKTYAQSYFFKNHLRIHSGEKPYKCSHCDKAFTNSRILKNHLQTHSGEKPYKCSQCDKTFARSDALKKHLYFHIGIKPFKCSHCNKAFTQSDTLKRHLEIHSGIKPFNCYVCNKAFTYLVDMKRHLRIHSGEKPYMCSHCKKTFAHSSSLKDHLRIHTGEKPYECFHCDKAFTNSSNLKHHVRIHSGEKPYKCSHCDKAFIESGQLKRHLQTHNGGKAI